MCFNKLLRRASRPNLRTIRSLGGTSGLQSLDSVASGSDHAECTAIGLQVAGLCGNPSYRPSLGTVASALAGRREAFDSPPWVRSLFLSVRLRICRGVLKVEIEELQADTDKAGARFRSCKGVAEVFRVAPVRATPKICTQAGGGFLNCSLLGLKTTICESARVYADPIPHSRQLRR
jgi:hypothetical protein